MSSHDRLITVNVLFRLAAGSYARHKRPWGCMSQCIIIPIISSKYSSYKYAYVQILTGNAERSLSYKDIKQIYFRKKFACIRWERYLGESTWAMLALENNTKLSRTFAYIYPVFCWITVLHKVVETILTDRKWIACVIPDFIFLLHGGITKAVYGNKLIWRNRRKIRSGILIKSLCSEKCNVFHEIAVPWIFSRGKWGFLGCI